MTPALIFGLITLACAGGAIFVGFEEDDGPIPNVLVQLALICGALVFGYITFTALGIDTMPQQ